MRTNLEGLITMTLVMLPQVGETVINLGSRAGVEGYPVSASTAPPRLGYAGSPVRSPRRRPDLKIYTVYPERTATQMTGYRGDPPAKVADVIFGAAMRNFRPSFGSGHPGLGPDGRHLIGSLFHRSGLSVRPCRPVPTMPVNGRVHRYPPWTTRKLNIRCPQFPHQVDPDDQHHLHAAGRCDVSQVEDLLPSILFQELDGLLFGCRSLPSHEDVVVRVGQLGWVGLEHGVHRVQGLHHLHLRERCAVSALPGSRCSISAMWGACPSRSPGGWICR